MVPEGTVGDFRIWRGLRGGDMLVNTQSCMGLEHEMSRGLPRIPRVL